MNKKFENIFFVFLIVFIAVLSFYTNDNKFALAAAVCGISYSILAGKGKVLCYYLGVTGSACYSYLSYKNGFLGNLALYALYLIPMQILGIFKWSKHLKEGKAEIIKTSLSKKEFLLFLLSAPFLILITGAALSYFGGNNPFMDSILVICTIFGQILTLKRCIEQWYFWFAADLSGVIMWIIAYIKGSNCLATIIMWAVYVFLAIYFLEDWKKELNGKN